jgi:acyl-coenzyme A synthetase/AMP-(fatty) acid ligase
MVIDHIYQWARIEPFKAALIHDDQVIDYITYAKSIEALRRFLGRHELPAGTTSIVLVHHLGAAWGLNMALRSLGLTTIQVNSLAHAKALHLKNVSCVVTTESEQAVHGLTDERLAGAKLIVASPRDILARSVIDLPLSPHSTGSSGGHIFYTSGTTGAYKKLMWDSDREDARTCALFRAFGFNQGTLIHVWRFGQWTGVGWKNPLSVWRTGGCVVFDQRPDWHERFFHHAITTTRLLPWMLRQLIDASNHPPSDCEILVSGGLMPSEIITKAIAKFGNRLRHNYGTTELIPSAPLGSRIRNQDDALWLEPTADRTVQIVNDDGLECSPNQEGNLRIRLTELDCYHYLDDEEATAKVFRNGYFYPGDRAVRRADGRIRILGRAADVLNLKGQKIAVAPLEEKIQQFLRVDNVCLFGGLNDQGIEELVVVIEAEQMPARAELSCVAASFKMFERVRFERLNAFPRTETGYQKIKRNELRKMAFDKSQANTSPEKLEPEASGPFPLI